MAHKYIGNLILVGDIGSTKRSKHWVFNLYYKRWGITLHLMHGNKKEAL